MPKRTTFMRNYMHASFVIKKCDSIVRTRELNRKIGVVLLIISSSNTVVIETILRENTTYVFSKKKKIFSTQNTTYCFYYRDRRIITVLSLILIVHIDINSHTFE